jgi:hypothetical protein
MARAFSTAPPDRPAPVAMTPRMTPAERRTRVQRARVDISDGDDLVADQ